MDEEKVRFGMGAEMEMRKMRRGFSILPRPFFNPFPLFSAPDFFFFSFNATQMIIQAHSHTDQ
jgi:hypothetical protein